MVRIFDVHNKVVVPTEHCYALAGLKLIMDTYPNDYLEVYKYIYYMTCPDPEHNPFFDADERDKEEIILGQVDCSMFTPEDDAVVAGLQLCATLYKTPTTRAYQGIKSMLDRLASYMETTEVTHGRDGNITALVNAAAKFEAIRQSYKGALKDLQEEQKSRARGGQNLAYDEV
jgi:hypothetical protein